MTKSMKRHYLLHAVVVVVVIYVLRYFSTTRSLAPGCNLVRSTHVFIRLKYIKLQLQLSHETRYNNVVLGESQ